MLASGRADCTSRLSTPHGEERSARARSRTMRGARSALRLEKAGEPLLQTFFCPQLAFPQNEDAPSRPSEPPHDCAIASAIALDFLSPVRDVRPRLARPARARMAMPKAAVDEDGALAGDIGEVGAARNVAAVQPIAGSDGVCEPAHDSLRPGVARLHRAHDGGAEFRRLRSRFRSLRPPLPHLRALSAQRLLRRAR